MTKKTKDSNDDGGKKYNVQSMSAHIVVDVFCEWIRNDENVKSVRDIRKLKNHQNSQNKLNKQRYRENSHRCCKRKD